MDVTVRFSKAGCLAELQGLRDVNDDYVFFLKLRTGKGQGP